MGDAYRPILLGVNANGKGKGKDGPPSDHREEPATTSQAEVSIAGSASGIAAVVTHPDEGQVSLDVNRSFVSFPGKRWSENALNEQL